MSTALLPPTPIQVRPLTGTSSLPIVELNRPDVEKSGKQVRLRKGSHQRATANCSFGPFSDHLPIDAWAFFHAAKKTELTTSFTTSFVDHRTLCFAEEHKELFHWNTANLRRVDRSVFALEDFAESSLAGRFGEAIAYLTMVKWGYVYWDRIGVLWERAASHTGMTHADMIKSAKIISSKVKGVRPDLEPDFAFENSRSEVALMEAKGSFVHPVNDDPSTKNDLRHALKQLDTWSGMVTPTPSKSFAIGTYFRDQSDVSGDPSLIAYVDPPGRVADDVRPAELPADWIRRGNYGAWLIGMGFVESGNALRWGRASGQRERGILTLNINGREFAIEIENVIWKLRSDGRYPPYWIHPRVFFDELYFDGLTADARFLRRLGVAAVQVVGIEASTLSQIEQALDNPQSMALLERESQSGKDLAVAPATSFDGFSGSIFPDGTLLGQVSPELLAEARMETYRL